MHTSGEIGRYIYQTSEAAVTYVHVRVVVSLRFPSPHPCRPGRRAVRNGHHGVQG
uniref:Uncharacterized protein n=1 Tax=Oryza sativa subsp. japonica TaxID=39947 RepID=Q8LHJ9_ORYSJ|nr:hypothetical protein [Oryza sativa Japonica Group]